MASEISHDDKYNDPRARITRRGVLLGVAVIVLAIIGAYVSIVGRRTKIEKSTEFWGQDTITALQIGERFELVSLDAERNEPINLTAMPGLGLLRQALLDDRNYDWSTKATGPIGERLGADEQDDANRIRFRLTDPTAKRVGTVELDFDLNSGWIGTADGAKSVRMNEHTRPKLKNFLTTVMHAEQKRYDFRE